MPVNRIVTRGMGPSRGKPGRAGLITRGYGGIFEEIVEVTKKAARAIVRGGTKAARRIPEIIYRVYARLMSVNENLLLKNVSGTDAQIVDLNIEDPKITANIESSKISNRSRDDILITASTAVRVVKKGGDRSE